MRITRPIGNVRVEIEPVADEPGIGTVSVDGADTYPIEIQLLTDLPSIDRFEPPMVRVGQGFPIEYRFEIHGLPVETPQTGLIYAAHGSQVLYTTGVTVWDVWSDRMRTQGPSGHGKRPEADPPRTTSFPIGNVRLPVNTLLNGDTVDNCDAVVQDGAIAGMKVELRAVPEGLVTIHPTQVTVLNDTGETTKFSITALADGVQVQIHGQVGNESLTSAPLELVTAIPGTGGGPFNPDPNQ